MKIVCQPCPIAWILTGGNSFRVKAYAKALASALKRHHNSTTIIGETTRKAHQTASNSSRNRPLPHALDKLRQRYVA